jgi:protease PrsW
MRPRHAIGVAATILSLAPAWGFYQMVTGTPWLIVVAAVVPALAWTGIVLLLDRDDPEPPGVLLAMFLWGAVVAALTSQTVNDGAYAWLTAVVGIDWARAWTPALFAPIVEEALKAGGLVVLWLVWRAEVDGVRDGIVYGAVIGMGFAMTENLAYFLVATVQGGFDGLARAMYLRAFLQGFNHAAFTATTGAALGWYARRARSSAWIVVLGFVAAVAQHVLWNAIGAQAVTHLLCGAATPGGNCQLTPTDTSLFLTVPLVVLAFLVPGGATLLGLGWFARTTGSRPTPS